VLRDLWNRLMRRESAAAVKRETEREQMSPAERRIVGESVEDIQADTFVGEHLGGVDPERLIEDDEPPRD
jgi:predicted RNA-binding protein Jag